MMKRMAREGSMPGRTRVICKIEAEELDVALEDSGGTYTPFSMNDLIFDIRRRDEADGERRMMGSGRRIGALGC
jgi:hypothetical protein